jgi:hypothetical protein
MKKHLLIAGIVLALVAAVWAQTCPYGSGDPNPDLHGTSAQPGGGNDDHQWEEGGDADGDGEPDTAVFKEDKNETIAGTQNTGNATPINPYGAKTMVFNGTTIHADGTWCTTYTHVQDLQQNPWYGLITVIEFCCEDMNAQWGPHCYWNVYYTIVSTWHGTSGQLSQATINMVKATPNAGPGSSGPRAGQSQ